MVARHAHISRGSDRELADQLAAYVDADPARCRWLVEQLRGALRRLAPRGKPPSDAASALAWRAVILAAARWHSSRVRRVPSGTFLDPIRFQALLNEGRRRRPAGRHLQTQCAAPGPVLRRLAVDRALRRATSRAIGFQVVPAYTAVYMYDPPRSHVLPHLDADEFEIIVHIVLEHVVPRKGCGSALVVHRPRRDVRLPIGPGEAVVLAGRGAVHQWERLGSGETRMLVGIGFKPA